MAAKEDQIATSESWADKRVFTTGEAAQVCKVSQQTIIRCFDAGRLTGFRVPGSKFRRIPRDELLRFIRANNIPTDALEGAQRRVLIVDDDPPIVQLIVDVLSRDKRLQVQTASTGYDAGLMTEAFKPHLILLDYMLPDINGNVVCKRVRERPDTKDTKIVIVSGVVNEAEIKGLFTAGADDFIKKPFDVDKLSEVVARHLGLDAPSGKNA
ncbi:MAG: response regulator [Planctomycetota bacterium]|nr:response regulator [Planctomycetota bacterium]